MEAGVWDGGPSIKRQRTEWPENAGSYGSSNPSSWTPQTWGACATHQALSSGTWSVAEQLRKNSREGGIRIAEQKANWNAVTSQEATAMPAIDWASRPRAAFRREFVPYGFADLKESQSLRDRLGITVEQDPSGEHLTPKPIEQFHEITILPEWVRKALRDNGWDSPTPIQAQALPIALAGRDMIGIAQTGSGKTAAFLLPALIHIEDQPPLTRHEPGPITLVLAPTRELAIQISDEAWKLAKHSWESARLPNGLKSAVFYGGGFKGEQLKEFPPGAHIVAATPGRLIDFLSQGTVSLRRVTYLVLDEADRMLDMGFAGDVRTISSQVRPERQTMFFSATWSVEVQTLAMDFCSQDPVRMRADANGSSGNQKSQHVSGTSDDDGIEDDMLSARDGIMQDVIVMDDEDWQVRETKKTAMLMEHIRQTMCASPDNKILVFVNEKGFADELVNKLYGEGFKVDAIHGGRKQAHRMWALDEFRKGNVSLLIATDVLGRGIDIPNVTHVVIYNMGTVEGYIHRIGRTARGKEAKGNALVLFEYYWKQPGNAEQLVRVLERCNQAVPDKLRQIAQEVAEGKRDICDEYGKRIPVGKTCAAWAAGKKKW